jgi:pyruvate formate lyase activating enzyme
MAQCRVCKEISPYISEMIGVCLRCIREKPTETHSYIRSAHTKSREVYGLPAFPPKDPLGILCNICVNECRIPENQTGYCGLKTNKNGKLEGVSSKRGKLSWYHDPLPTNCVGDRVCPGGTGAGYPEYAYRRGPETGYKNLAVFFHACSFNCLFCQNWHFKEATFKTRSIPVQDLVLDVDEKTACICFFGGDPAPQLPYSLRASKLSIDRNKDRILRVCWETNGSMHPKFLDEMVKLAMDSGGCIKFDLKAWNENLHVALTGSTNRRTLENFKRAGEHFQKRPVPPPVIANTLLVPGYVDEDEIRGIAKFIASVDPEIPYSLLAFHPQFQMADMPLTSRDLAEKCLEVAQDEGLTRVRIGNFHLLK